MNRMTFDLEDNPLERLSMRRNKYDPTKDSRAVVANAKSGGVVLWYVGYHLYEEIEIAQLVDLDDLGLEEAPEGISIWEGIYGYTYDSDSGKIDLTEPEGDFREPTEEEWSVIKQGKPPWDERQWIIEEPNEVSENTE